MLGKLKLGVFCVVDGVFLFLFLEFLFQVWVNGFEPAGTAGPGMGTHLLDVQVNRAGMVPLWLNGFGFGTICTHPEPDIIRSSSRKSSNTSRIHLPW